MKKRGFTLVELMVVIAIIAVLAAVAAPQVFRQMSKGRTAAIESFYSSVKTACTTYFSDTARWPAAGTAGFFANPGAPTVNWDGPYLSSWPPKNAWGGDNLYRNASGLIFHNAGPAANERYLEIQAVPALEADRIDLEIDGVADRDNGLVEVVAGTTDFNVLMLISRDGATD